MFYEIYVALCNEKNISPTKAAVEIGLSNAAPTGWKQGATPRNAVLKKIADYFGVTTDYLLSGEQAPVGARKELIEEIQNIDDPQLLLQIIAEATKKLQEK